MAPPQPAGAKSPRSGRRPACSVAYAAPLGGRFCFTSQRFKDEAEAATAAADRPRAIVDSLLDFTLRLRGLDDPAAPDPLHQADRQFSQALAKAGERPAPLRQRVAPVVISLLRLQ
jgi:hypothetical protein